MKVGLMLPAVGSVELNAAGLDGAAAMGVDSVWFPDHLLGFVHPEIWRQLPAARTAPDSDAFLDPFCLAASLGHRTDIALGTCVTDATRRRGADLARTALTLDASCGGGFILGIGAGEAESLLPFGYDFDRPVAKLESALAEIRSLLDTGRMPTGGLGRNGLFEANPASKPEVWVAAHGPRALRLTGRYADGWLPAINSSEVYADMLAVVHDAADKFGRPRPTASHFPLTIFGESRDAVLAELDRTPALKLIALFADGTLWSDYGLEHPGGPNIKRPDVIPHEYDPQHLRELAPRIPAEMMDEFALLGNADEVFSGLRAFRDAGAEHMVLGDFTGIVYTPDELPDKLHELAKLIVLLHAA